MSRMASMTVEERRKYFPRGLSQPEKGYRFSIDALLLASFARLPKKGGTGLDLGSGSGVIGLALALQKAYTQLSITGLDIQSEMVECAKANAEALGLADNLDYILTDVSSYADLDNRADFVVTNPPYRIQGRGRVSPGESKATARFETGKAMADFCKAATRALKDKAPLFMVHLPERLADAMAACQAATLTPARLRFVHSRKEEPARIMLFEARKNGGSGLIVETPLFLYEGQGEDTRMTEAALAFCPFLQCNAG